MKKLYYSIGEVSNITDIEPHVLRYWETVFDELNPKKNNGGNRVYKENDLKLVIKLKKLIKDQKYSTKGARQILENKPNAPAVNEDIAIPLQKDLQEIRLFLKKLLKQI